MARRRYATTTNTTSSGFGGSSSIKLAIAGAIFAIGIAVGVALSTLNPTTQTVDAIRLDIVAPNRDFCNNFGSAAMVMNSRVYVTLNPFNVYVSQAEPIPGCVVLPNNWNELLRRGAIGEKDIRLCKDRMNTFGFTGDLDKKALVDCVYESRDAQKKLFTENLPTPTPTPAP
ncbi:DUF3172 domain-containing protein [Pseudanabaena sp. PCC 6802]|uniref:DUF3172 domain-containing protein n=1 Tax=Pseudanabaena sp. PCC 6802 TaxID=118173 RepID=UPI00034B39EC|nr:DUF3172 domain-containing protein [Pseudanabaena sp. PCC 6802]